MNVVGNALKYTTEGFVEISLARLKQPSASGQLIAHLSVTDSGCGMSSEFLRNRLFSPFSQENQLSEGVGLGLSIVRQLATLLDGSIDLKSEPDVGTQVDIFIPVERVAQPPEVPAVIRQTKPTLFCLVGFNAYPDLAEAPTGTLGRDAKRRLCIQSFLTHLVTTQLDWSVTFVEALDDVDGDVAIVESSVLMGDASGSGASESIARVKINRILVLEDVISSAAVSEFASRVEVIRVTQPYVAKLTSLLSRLPFPS